MYQVSVATLTKLASAYCARVLAPVAPDPAKISVTPPAGLTVVAFVAMIKIAVPTGKDTVALVGMVMVPDP